jgi:hypothetical protein
MTRHDGRSQLVPDKKYRLALLTMEDLRNSHYHFCERTTQQLLKCSLAIFKERMCHASSSFSCFGTMHFAVAAFRAPARGTKSRGSLLSHFIELGSPS